MKIYNKIVIDMDLNEILEEDSFEYDGPIARCDVGGAVKTVSGLAQNISPVVKVGSDLLGLYSQSKMLGDAAKSSKNAYKDYLSAINPPKEVLDTRFAEAKSNILNTASSAQRRLSDTLASRGIRGKGVAAPMGNFSNQVQDALNQAYWNVYGNYNIPSGPGPSGYAPNMWELGGVNFAQMMNYMYPYLNANSPNNNSYWEWMNQHAGVGR